MFYVCFFQQKADFLLIKVNLLLYPSTTKSWHIALFLKSLKEMFYGTKYVFNHIKVSTYIHSMG